MSTPVILISIFLVLAVFVPFFVLNSSGKGGAKLISKKIKEITKEYGLKLDQKESWGNSFIAVDRAQRVLLFAKVFKTEVFVERIALDQVERSTIQKKLKLEKSISGKVNVLQKLDLEVIFLAHHKETLLLNLYDIDNGYTEDYEMQRAEKWGTVINEMAKTALVGRKVA